MTKFKILIVSFLFVLSAQYAFAQDDTKVIEINNTSISQPSPHDFGDITGRVYVKYVVKNNRNILVKVSEITTPAGFFANISDKNIAAGKKVILYVGLDPAFVEKKGSFNEKITVKTNLIKNIEVSLKGVIK